MKHLNDNELVLALDGEMDEAELNRAVNHLAECEACRERWEKLQGLSARVAEYSSSLYEKSLAADERRFTLIERPRVFAFSGWRWGFAAAMVLLALGLEWFTRPVNSLPIVSTISHLGPPDRVEPELHAPDKGMRQSKGYEQAKRGHVSKSTAASKSDLAANQFTELPFSNAALPLDQATATVVRVTLPAAALRQAGVAVNEDSANAMLQADVVLGMDGLPRGIRLVNSSSSGTAN